MSPSALDELRLRRLIDAGRGLIAELDVEAVLKQLLDVAREITGARYAAVGVLDDRREELARFITAGIDPDTHRAIGDLPRGRGILGLLIEEPRPLRLEHIGDHPRSYGFPVAHPEMETFLGVPVMVRDQVWGNLYLTEKDNGEPFTDADEESAVILADWAAIAIDNARLYSSVEQRRDHLERANRGLDTTVAIATALGGETDLSRILELIVKRARALVGARTLVIMLAQDDQLVVAAGAGELRAAVHGQRMPIEGTVTGRVLRSRRPERIENAQTELQASLEMLGFQATSALLVPLAFRGRSVGVLAAYDRLGEVGEFDREHERLLTAFAASAATAVATGRQVEEERLRAEHRGVRAGAPPLGARAARRDVAGAGRPARRPVIGDARLRRRAAHGDRDRGRKRDRGDRQPARADRRAAPGRARRVRGRRQRSRASPSEPPRARASPSTRTSTSPSSAATKLSATRRSSRAPRTGWSRRR